MSQEPENVRISGTFNMAKNSRIYEQVSIYLPLEGIMKPQQIALLLSLTIGSFKYETL
jgi:hypothetical protein